MAEAEENERLAESDFTRDLKTLIKAAAAARGKTVGNRNGDLLADDCYGL